MKTTPGLAPNAVPECPAQLAPAGTLRAEGVTVEIGPAFTIAVARDKTPGTGGGLCLFPQVFKVERRLFINWKFDWDVADAQEATVPNGLVSDDDGRSWGPAEWTPVTYSDTRGVDIYDPHGANSWLKTHGHGRIIGRLISVRP